MDCVGLPQSCTAEVLFEHSAAVPVPAVVCFYISPGSSGLTLSVKHLSVSQFKSVRNQDAALTSDL